MALKRKFSESKTIIYGSEVACLKSLIDEADSHTSIEGSQTLMRDSALAAFTDQEIIWEASKIAYLLFHNLETKEKILHSIGIKCDTPQYQDWTRQLSTKQSQWKGAILNKFFLSHVKELIRKWCVAHPWRRFAALPSEERAGIWSKAYDSDPKRTTISMFKPVIGGLDMSIAFDEELSSDHDMAKMIAVQEMFRKKYLFGCEITYENRIQANKKDICFDRWARYTQDESLFSTVVSPADLPVSSTLLTPRVPEHKKQKTD